jgi:NADH:ubiquinone oxidoreductase subunit E
MSEVQNCACKGAVTDEELYTMLDEILEDYFYKPGALIPVLQITQKLFGYLPTEALKKISLKLDKPYSEVAGVVSFYSFFSTYPRGKYMVRVCLGTACYVRGGKEILNSLKKELSIDVGQTTPDRLFSIDVGRCFGACGIAPVVMVNDDVHVSVKPEKIGNLLDSYRNIENVHEGGK